MFGFALYVVRWPHDPGRVVFLHAQCAEDLVAMVRSEESVAGAEYAKVPTHVGFACRVLGHGDDACVTAEPYALDVTGHPLDLGTLAWTLLVRGTCAQTATAAN